MNNKIKIALALGAASLLTACLEPVKQTEKATETKCTENVPAVNTDAMYQVATLQSLVLGNYDGFVTVEELRRHGDIGIGTFQAVDGEMIVLDGTVYQATGDGSVKIANNNTTVPFATVTHFETDIQTQIDNVASLKDLIDKLDKVVKQHGANQIYVVRIDVENCDTLLVRSELAQNKPYRPLAEVLATDQREFTYTNIGGSVVAVYFPEFFTSQNTPGWHCHFISSDRTKGGHMLNMVIAKPVTAQFDATPYFEMYMPDDASFNGKNLGQDLSKEIDKVEK